MKRKAFLLLVGNLQVLVVLDGKVVGDAGMRGLKQGLEGAQLRKGDNFGMIEKKRGGRNCCF